MAAVCTAPATVLAVSLDDARDKARVAADDGLDEQLTLSLQGLIAETEHEIGQCLMEQGWQVTLDAFPVVAAGDEAAIRLPHPVLAVQSVKYFDQAGVERTLAGTAYEIVEERYRSFLVPTPGTTWPATMARKRAVTVQCTAGYGNDPAQTPAAARQYILARLELEFCPPPHPPTVEQLGRMLAPLIVYG